MDIVLSKRLLWLLECLGYGHDQRKQRKDVYKLLDQRRNEDIHHVFTFITVGSKGEGLTNAYEKDRDLLVIEKSGVCVDQFYDLDCPVIRDRNIFILDTQYSSPGHGLLISVRSVGLIGQLLGNSMTDLDGQNVLSSEKFSREVDKFVKTSVYFGNGTEIQPRSGPATRIAHGFLQEDHVYALECHCPMILEEWASRKRENGWPSSDVIQQVKEIPGYVVATGCKESVYKELEWRICFNIGEQKLLETLNDVQTKIYVLLKMIVAEIIQPESDELTSFMMKNIVFWLAELNPQFVFSEESLVQWLLNAMQYLKNCLERNFLPYYMIPNRNLFSGKMNEEQRQVMLVKVISLIQEGPKFLLQSRRLRTCLNMSILNKELLQKLGKNRNEAEILLIKVLYLSRRQTVHLRAGLYPHQDPEAICEEETMWRKIADLIWAGWREDAICGRYDHNKLVTSLSEILT